MSAQTGRPDHVPDAQHADGARLAWRAARARATAISLDQAWEQLAGAAGGRAPQPPRPRTAAEHAAAVVRLLGAPEQVPVAGRPADPLTAALDAADMRHRPVRLEGRWWRAGAVPLVGFLGPERQPVALLPGHGRMVLADPATGRRVRLDAELAARLDAEAWQVYPPLGRVETLGGLLRFALRGSGRTLWLLGAAGLGAALLGVAVPLLSARLLTAGRSSAGTHVFGWTTALIAAAVIASALLTLVRNSLIVRVEGHIQAALEPAVWGRLVRLPTGFFARFGSGDLVQRANGVAGMRKAVGDVAVGSLFGTVFSSLSLTVLVLVDWRLAVLVVPGVVLAIAVMARLAVRQQAHLLETFGLYGRIYSLLYGFMLGIDKIQIAGREGPAFGLWARLFAAQKAAEADALRRRAGATALAAGIQPMLLVLVVVGASWVDPGVAAGPFLASVIALGQFGLAIGQWHRAVESAFSLTPRFERMRPLLVAEPEDADAGARREPGELTGRVELQGVSFAYDGTAARILDDVTLGFAPGEFAAVVGASGAGKSTLVRLLLGFERPRVGQVLFDGRDLEDLDLRRVRRQIGVVMQQARVLRGTVLENITGIAPGLGEDEAWHAAELAGLADDIRALPMGMHTAVGEDSSSFSGGQLQRLLIARALVKKPRIVILDEATSALDNTTQALVSRRVAGLAATRIVIAHRLSTIRHADRIHVLEGGHVTGSGGYRDLLGSHELFTRLVRRQEV